MGKAYDEVMDKIEVTPEMRQRVLRRVAAEDIFPARPKVLSFPKLKKYLPAAACLVLIIAGAAALPWLLGPGQPEPPPVLVPSGIEQAGSLQELSALVGFDVDADFALPFEPEETTYCSYWNELAQIQYSGQGQTATYRQSAGTQDNSGDYTNYDEASGITIGGTAIALKGGAGGYVLATWTDGAFSYSLKLSEGITEAGWQALLAQAPGTDGGVGAE